MGVLNICIYMLVNHSDLLNEKRKNKEIAKLKEVLGGQKYLSI